MSLPVPNELVLDDQVFDVDFSPADEIVAAATITGGVSVYAYHPNENKLLHQFSHHTAPCRSVLFSNDGAGRSASILTPLRATGIYLYTYIVLLYQDCGCYSVRVICQCTHSPLAYVPAAR
eukprot:TRINITY_DN573_c0_g1_i1.p1 TRINITY_DN573_c0_g1~~TRINITY_DN573_c0_g1_i1.p1  ORF type:complete len:121 (-),score=2.90 TRINITY_DN573_c0_g1_i1:6-368(-)